MRIGIDLGGTKIHGILLAPDGTIARSLRIATPRDDYAGTLQAIVSLAQELDASGTTRVGIGTPGSWLAERGAMQNCNSTWLNGQPLLTDLCARLDDRVRIANDADCFAVSEALPDTVTGVLFGVILGTGVGAGIVVNGKLLSGRNGLAGEWGHTPLPYFRYDQGSLEVQLDSRRCYCGRLDCIETFLSGPGLALTHLALWGVHATPEEIHEEARQEAESITPSTPAQVTMDIYEGMLARSLAQIVNTLDPHVIVLGGGLSNMTRLYRTLAPRMRAHVFCAECDTVLRAPLWGDSSGVRGAAWLWEADE